MVKVFKTIICEYSHSTSVFVVFHLPCFLFVSFILVHLSETPLYSLLITEELFLWSERPVVFILGLGGFLH